jgi:hypothetical protein
MASRTTPGPATLAAAGWRDRLLPGGWLLRRGAAHAISVVDSYVHGFVLQEVNLPFRNEAELAAMTGAIMDEFPGQDFPYLFELTIGHVLGRATTTATSSTSVSTWCSMGSMPDWLG